MKNSFALLFALYYGLSAFGQLPVGTSAQNKNVLLENILEYIVLFVRTALKWQMKFMKRTRRMFF